MIGSFADPGTEDIFNGRNSAEARRTLPRDLWKTAFRKLDQINVAVSLDDLKVPPGNRLEALRGDRSGEHSIRINDQYRICFQWTEGAAEAVEIVDYHG
jgi:proteic killer suppression protein